MTIDKFKAARATITAAAEAAEQRSASDLADVYVPIAVWAGPDHAHEGGGGGYVSQAEAMEMGATNIRVSTFQGKATPWNGMVADWPQHYFPPASPACKCAGCQSPGRWS